MKAEPKIADAFRSGAGFGWHEHDHGLFEGTERFFRPNYVGNLVSSWIPSLTGVEEKLRRGGRVADVGCGHGASTILLAQAYPEVDLHRLRLPRPVHRGRAQGRAARGRVRPRLLRAGAGQGVSRT